jgi:hypothetical protein
MAADFFELNRKPLVTTRFWGWTGQPIKVHLQLHTAVILGQQSNAFNTLLDATVQVGAWNGVGWAFNIHVQVLTCSTKFQHVLGATSTNLP